ncbi:Retrovirus-related Pol polyprotein from type-1 retrotransposable element R1 (Fragment) [Anthophora quadrimaculata]
MDTLLDDFEATFDVENIQAIAYADDLTIIVKGNTRSDLETSATKATDLVNNWCTHNKLKVSSNKTHAMLMKGKLHKDRLPEIILNSNKVKYQNKIKYLGLIVDNKLNFIEHSKYLKETKLQNL